MTPLFRRGAAAVPIALAVSIPRTSHAQKLRLEDLSYEAGQVEADPMLRTLTLRDHVVVVYGRYRLESDALTLRLTPRGIYVDGTGRVAFCPCSDPPVTIGFSGARVAPPGELLLTFPRVEIERVPVILLPWLWIRSHDRPGLLPPALAWRGDDGFFAGAGVHMPWRGSDGAPRFVDVTAGGYVKGGAELGARVETPTSTTHLVWDELRENRTVFDARGYYTGPREGPDEPRVAWDVDAIRGDRGRRGTIDLEQAARPFDVGAAETSVRAGPALIGTGVAARAIRGDGRILVGPESSLSLGGALGRSASWDLGASGVALGNDIAGSAIPIAVADAGADFGTHAGPIAIGVDSRERARVAGRGEAFADTAPSEDALASAALHIGLPIARSFASNEAGRAPVVHVITPEVEGRIAVGASRGSFFLALRQPVAPVSWITDAGIASALGRYGGGAASIDLRAGAYGRLHEEPLPVAHGRLRASSGAIGLGVEAATVGTNAAGAEPFARGGVATVARARLGPEGGPNFGVEAAVQRGEDARAARAIADGTAAALPGDELAYFSDAGTTGAALVHVPWTWTLATFARVDADFDAGEIIGGRGDIAYRHTCGCLVIDLAGARRVGRGGVDVWLTVDLAPSRLP